MKGLVGGALVFAVIAGACSSGTDTSSRTPTSPSSGASNYSSYPTAPYYSSPPAALPVAASRVARVIDGDSFVLDSGEEVRVLGIDSCEMSSDMGSAAKSSAEGFLLGSSVTLTTEPGADTDRYGRLLRYVASPTLGDMGKYMVASSHTAVYEGDNDASPQRLTELEALDYGGRTCDLPAATSSSDDDRESTYRPSTSDDDHSSSSPRRRTGHSGHPCLPGERDGDNDGYCGEGR